MHSLVKKIFCLIAIIACFLTGCSHNEVKAVPAGNAAVSLESIPAYSGKPYIVINNNKPAFSKEDFVSKGFEKYSKLDSLGRCGIAFANVGKETMPTEKRGSISEVKPSGWVQARYDFVDGKSLYNRCHLIGFQLTAENANKENLITGTRYLNVQGMLPFENMVADYVKETGNHVLYRVSPIYQGNNLVASGVQMEAQSVEDKGAGILFNIYCYNVQPGVEIDYATGKSRLSGKQNQTVKHNEQKQQEYVLNTSSKKIHLPDCSGVKNISSKNKKEYQGTKAELEKTGYTACGICKP